MTADVRTLGIEESVHCLHTNLLNLKKLIKTANAETGSNIHTYTQSSQSTKKLKTEPAQTTDENTTDTAASGDRSSSPPPSNNTPPALSPEQKARIEGNKQVARMRLVSKNTHGLVCNMGSSWFRALEAEFSKPYFLQVSGYTWSGRV